MNISDYLNLILNTTNKDWIYTQCWDSSCGPSYKNSFEFYEILDSEPNQLVLEQFNNRATLKSNLSISLAWGLACDPYGEEKVKIQEPWSVCYPDKTGGYAKYLDLFYNDSFIFRTMYVSVDGARCKLPYAEKEGGLYLVSHEYSKLVGVINSIEGLNLDKYNDYLRRSGITLIEKPMIE